MSYNMRHGGPWDRGSADSYCGRPRRPHYFTGATYQSDEVLEANMTQGEIDAYDAGYGIDQANDQCDEEARISEIRAYGRAP